MWRFYLAYCEAGFLSGNVNVVQFELAHATAVVRLAAASLLRDEALDWNDYCTLVKAEEVIGNARTFFCETPKFRQVGARS